MGQRANYIIKEHSLLTIHYHHWGANSITSDLYVGEKRFLAFVKECKMSDVLLDEIWIEGCVIVDLPSQHLYFWSLEFLNDTSVVEYYLSQLRRKWKGWNVELLKNQMYDVERILGIDYLSTQTFTEPYKVTTEQAINDKPGEWENAIVLIREEEELFVIRTGDLGVESIISYGQDIVPILKTKDKSSLPVEGDNVPYQCISMDLTTQRIVIGDSSFGLLEQCRGLWEGFDFLMGDFGYIEVLELSGIDTTGFRMSDEKVIQEFNDLVSPKRNFDPHEFAKKLLTTEKDAQFNPNFFDNVRPQRSIFEKFKLGLKKIFTK